jgi:hypothetical protein
MTEGGDNGRRAAEAAPSEPRDARGEPAPDRPDPEFEVLSASPIERAAAPTMSFRLEARDVSGLRVHTIALTVLITIEPAKRRYEPSERARLVELFGEPERWAATTESFRWTQASALVPGFEAETSFALEVECSYDLELAAAKYFAGLDDGDAPLRFHFNGTVFYEAGGGRMQVVPLPWDRSTRFALPVATWQRMIVEHYPHRSWVPLDRRTVDRLIELKARRGLPTFDAAVEELLGAADDLGEGG